MKFGLLSTLATGLLSAGVALAEAANGTIAKGPFPNELNGSNFTYPYPVHLFKFFVQQQNLEMAFMDIKPSCEANGRTVVLLHGKNFCGPTWGSQIQALSGAGYRVIAPDQIGFCKSSKPRNFQFSLSQLAWNTRGLLNALDIGNVTVIGHSLGGMLATRFTLQYANTVDRLILTDAIGFEDYVEKGVPYISIDDQIKTEAASTFASIKAYEEQFYYVGQWQDSYNTWVTMLVNIYNGPQREAYIECQGKIVDLVLTQPIAKYFGDITAKTLIIVGDKDKTAIGQWAPASVLATLGHFDVLGPQIAAQIKGSTLYQFPTLGHAPQISNPSGYNSVVLNWLSKH